MKSFFEIILFLKPNSLPLWGEQEQKLDYN